eukprot:scaffold89571_cov17-Tisochrysis_lutea.AAC.1
MVDANQVDDTIKNIGYVKVKVFPGGDCFSGASMAGFEIPPQMAERALPASKVKLIRGLVLEHIAMHDHDGCRIDFESCEVPIQSMEHVSELMRPFANPTVWNKPAFSLF